MAVIYFLINQIFSQKCTKVLFYQKKKKYTNAILFGKIVDGGEYFELDFPTGLRLNALLLLLVHVFKEYYTLCLDICIKILFGEVVNDTGYFEQDLPAGLRVDEYPMLLVHVII